MRSARARGGNGNSRSGSKSRSLLGSPRSPFLLEGSAGVSRSGSGSASLAVFPEDAMPPAHGSRRRERRPSASQVIQWPRNGPMQVLTSESLLHVPCQVESESWDSHAHWPSNDEYSIVQCSSARSSRPSIVTPRSEA
eukprot:CAMPEP_0206436230 /NCGR_PEP_ID=MMETSP0324_2-20121206/10361_1 /ASSEMBLY_ACC=CAM_ASM_000836 /TAXON_ID=2866 /ORGANISM="Crypthecodinium cohnii, Strain Seligo" /LENGTH=137 /DNA_ID=CAMNT_0053903359 /DNA_START=501 /DNA_END=914 /DNA_ORIENTATION=-